MSVESLSVHRITIQANSGAADGKGGTPESWAARHVNVACRIRPTSARERAQWSGLPTIASHVIYLPDRTLTVSERDRIIYGAREFRVLGVRDVDELARYRIIEVEEIR